MKRLLLVVLLILGLGVVANAEAVDEVTRLRAEMKTHEATILRLIREKSVLSAEKKKLEGTIGVLREALKAANDEIRKLETEQKRPATLFKVEPKKPSSAVVAPPKKHPLITVPSKQTPSSIRTKYDKFRDRTTVRTSSLYLFSKEGKKHEVHLWYTFEGRQKPEHIKTVTLYVIYSSSAWEYLEYRPTEITFIADGRKFAAKLYDYGSSVGDYVDGHRLEQLFFHLPVAQLRLLARAKKIEAQICNNEFDFTRPDHAFRELFLDMVRYVGVD